MKIRNGFVSNSSSSSFCITAVPNSKGKVLVEIDMDKIGTCCTTEQQLKKMFIQVYEYTPDDPECEAEDPKRKVLYDYCLNEIKNGKAVVVGWIDNTMFGVLKHVGKIAEEAGHICI